MSDKELERGGISSWTAMMPGGWSPISIQQRLELRSLRRRSSTIERPSRPRSELFPSNLGSSFNLARHELWPFEPAANVPFPDVESKRRKSDGKDGRMRETNQTKEQELLEMLEEKDRRLKEKEGELEKLEEQVRRMGEITGPKEQELRARLAEKEQKLSEKEAELGELKKTLCMYNDCSEIDIRNMLDVINTKIQDLAHNTAIRWYKALKKDSNRAGDSREVGDEEVGTMKGLIGSQFVDVLSDITCKPGQERLAIGLLLPLAWQASITATVARILSSFSAGLASTSNGRLSDTVLREIADRVMKGEAQPAYGRWRLITHQYLTRLQGNEEQAAIQAYVDEALANCRIVCRMVMKRACPNDQDFADAFRSQLYGIIDVAFGLLTLIQERMITANYEPYMPLNGESFDGEFMVVSKQDDVFPNDRVVCTTGLGLRYWRKEGRGNTSEMWPKSIFKEAEVFTEGNLRESVGV